MSPPKRTPKKWNEITDSNTKRRKNAAHGGSGCGKTRCCICFWVAQRFKPWVVRGSSWIPAGRKTGCHPVSRCPSCSYSKHCTCSRQPCRTNWNPKQVQISRSQSRANLSVASKSPRNGTRLAPTILASKYAVNLQATRISSVPCQYSARILAGQKRRAMSRGCSRNGRMSVGRVVASAKPRPVAQP